MVTSCRTSSPCAGPSCRRAPMAGAGRGASTACIPRPCFHRGSGRDPAELLPWLSPRPSPATILPHKLRDERYARCTEQTSTSEMPGKGLEGAREERKLLLPAAFRQKAGRRTPPSASTAAVAPLHHSFPPPSSTAVQTLTQERNQPCLSQSWDRG